jgi:MFS family permease
MASSDAILAELSNKKGFSYSLRYMMSTLGFFTGSLMISAIMCFCGQNFRLFFFLSVIPSLVAIYILKTKIKYNGNTTFKKRELHKWKIKDIALMSRGYWHFMVVISLLLFNRFSQGFIILRAKEAIPLHIDYFPLFMSIYEVCAISVAIPAGKLSDKLDVRKTLLFGLFCLFIADIFGIIANDVLTTIALYLFSGMHMGITHGILGSIVARMAPKHLIGTAFAFFYCIEGILLFFSNNIAGQSSKIAQFAGLQSSAGPFIIGIFAVSLSMLYICILIRRKIRF